VTVGGGSGCDPFAAFFGECGGTPDTFDDLLASFEGSRTTSSSRSS
jgi:hypothetical protein